MKRKYQNIHIKIFTYFHLLSQNKWSNSKIKPYQNKKNAYNK